MDELTRVLGVDARKAGWVGVVLGDGPPRAHVAATIAELVDGASTLGAPQLVAIDIPIGLPDAGRRTADVLAKVAVGPLRSSVFMTPVRPALQAPDHAAAVATNRLLAGEGVSVQAFGLRHRIFEVEQYLHDASVEVIEVHPEVCFARMHGGPLITRKSTWAGAEARRGLLASQGIELIGDLGMTGLDVRVDDVLDAAAAAWTARRHGLSQAISLPEPPEVFSDGWRTAIWV